MAKAYSYIRFSTPAQKLGDSLRRQIDHTAAYCLANDLTLDQSMRDEGLSGYHGVHRAKGALGRFINLVEKGEIEVGSVLIVEALDRLSRQEPSLAQEQFLTLVNRGVEIVTTIDNQRFSRKSINSNPGQLFMSLGMMLGNHAESAKKADRIRETWKSRRLASTNMVPSWIAKVGEKGNRTFVVVEEKAAIVRQIFADIQTMGVNTVAVKLNQAGIPCMSKASLPDSRWTPSAIRQLVRGRNVLGEQVQGKYVDNKRVLTGETLTGLYPAIIDEGTWFAANAAIDGRSRGVGNGANVTNHYPNLFGTLAICDLCGGRMKIKAKARVGRYSYFMCSNADVGTCTATGFHNLSKVEDEVLRQLGTVALGETKVENDPTTPILASIATAQAEAARLETQFGTLFERFGMEPADSLSGKALAKVEADHKAKLMQIRKLESALAGAKALRPASENIEALRALIMGLDGMEGAERLITRGRIANSLPGVVKAVHFGWEQVTVPEDRRPRADAPGVFRRIKAKVVPVSKFWIELVPNLPVTMGYSGDAMAVRFVHQMQHDPEQAAKAFSRSGDVVTFHPEKVRIPV